METTGVRPVTETRMQWGTGPTKVDQFQFQGMFQVQGLNNGIYQAIHQDQIIEQDHGLDQGLAQGLDQDQSKGQVQIIRNWIRIRDCIQIRFMSWIRITGWLRIRGRIKYSDRIRIHFFWIISSNLKVIPSYHHSLTHVYLCCLFVRYGVAGGKHRAGGPSELCGEEFADRREDEFPCSSGEYRRSKPSCCPRPACHSQGDHGYICMINIMIRKFELTTPLYMWHSMLSTTVCTENSYVDGIVILPVIVS